MPPTEEGRELLLLRERIEALEESFQASMMQPGTAAPPSVPLPSSPPTDVPSPTSSAKLPDLAAKEPKKGWTVKMGGHVQLDYVTWADATPSIPDTQDYFNFRRLRMVADGTSPENYDFRLQMTLEPDNLQDIPRDAVLTPQVKDAYFSLNEIPWLGRFRIGNFFVPFSLEQVTNDTNNIFVERSIPTQGIFSPDREVGMAIYNHTPSKRVTWASGVFLDSISEGLKKRIDDNQGYRVSGRVTWLPYFDEPSDGRYLLHTGLGILYTSDQDHRVRFRARPQVSEGPRLIDSGILEADGYTIGNFEAALVWGRFTLQSEAFLTGIDMLDGDSRTANGTYIHASWFVTGENRIYKRFGQHGPQFDRNVPYRNFSVTRGQISPGALELKARWSHMDLNNLQQGQYNDSTIGFNWYWSDRVRWMFDWIRPITSETALFGATSSDLLATRFDFNW
jgi:phosphate-selective porin OprO and OprP